MPNSNKIISDIVKIEKRMKKDLKDINKFYSILYDDVSDTFKSELMNQNGKIQGLEDFYALLMDVKSNRFKTRNMLQLILKLKDISDYSINSMKEEIEDNKEEAKDNEEQAELARLLEDLTEPEEIEEIVEQVEEKE